MEVTAKEQVRRDTLLAMYRSVDRANKHWTNGNTAGVIAERFYQENLKKDFESLAGDET